MARPGAERPRIPFQFCQAEEEGASVPKEWAWAWEGACCFVMGLSQLTLTPPVVRLPRGSSAVRRKKQACLCLHGGARAILDPLAVKSEGQEPPNSGQVLSRDMQTSVPLRQGLATAWHSSPLHCDPLGQNGLLSLREEQREKEAHGPRNRTRVLKPLCTRPFVPAAGCRPAQPWVGRGVEVTPRFSLWGGGE